MFLSYKLKLYLYHTILFLFYYIIFHYIILHYTRDSCCILSAHPVDSGASEALK